MGRRWAAVALLMVLVPLVGDGVSGRTGSVDAAYSFLYAMLDRSGGGTSPRLPQSYAGGTVEREGYTASTSYDNALVIDALLARGRPEDVARARSVGDGLLIAQARDPAGDGRLRAAYQPGPVPAEGAVPATNPATDVGAMAWAGRALLRLYDATGEASYLDGSRRLADWVRGHAEDTRGAGGYTGGLNAQGQPQRWKSTEQNLDLVSHFTALARATRDEAWTARARSAEGFVRSMYEPARHRFATGTGADGVTVNTEFVPADAQTWSYLVLRDPALAGSLDYAATALAATDGPYHGISVTEDERSTVWFEGTAHLALALRLRGSPGDAARADAYLATIERAQRDLGTGGGVPAASRDAPANAQGVRVYTSSHTGTTAWYVLAAASHNPF